MEPWPELVRADLKRTGTCKGPGTRRPWLSDPQMCKLHSKLSKDSHHSRAFTACQALLEVLSVSQSTYCVQRALGGIITRIR